MSRDDEQVWAELVESFHSPDDDTRQWPAAENIDPEVSNASDNEPGEPDTDQPANAAEPAGNDQGGGDQSRPGQRSSGQRGSGERGSGHRGSATHDTDEHFIPPPPPPLPSTDLITRAAWASVLGVPIFLTVVVLLGQSVRGWIGALCAAAFIGGFVILVARLRGHDPYDPDDGAVV